MSIKYVPKDKLSKKARRSLCTKQRKTWPCDPRTKVDRDRTKYCRVEMKRCSTQDIFGEL